MSSLLIQYPILTPAAGENPERESLDLLATSARRRLVDEALPLWWNKGYDWQIGTCGKVWTCRGVLHNRTVVAPVFRAARPTSSRWSIR